MESRVWRKDDYVINIDEDIFPQNILKNIVDEMLEYSWCVLETERHHSVLKVS